MELATMLAMGAFVGMFSTVFSVLMMPDALGDTRVVMLVMGGMFGGAVAAISLQPAANIGVQDIAFMALAGYFSGDVFVTLSMGRKT